MSSPNEPSEAAAGTGNESGEHSGGAAGLRATAPARRRGAWLGDPPATRRRARRRPPRQRAAGRANTGPRPPVETTQPDGSGPAAAPAPPPAAPRRPTAVTPAAGAGSSDQPLRHRHAAPPLCIVPKPEVPDRSRRARTEWRVLGVRQRAARPVGPTAGPPQPRRVGDGLRRRRRPVTAPAGTASRWAARPTSGRSGPACRSAASIRGAR